MSNQSDKNDKESWALVILRGSAKILESLEMAKTCGQSRYKLIPTAHLNAATRAGLIDMTLGKIKNGNPVGAPIIRFDNPHGGKDISKLPHINIDPTGAPNANNPHIAVPQSLISCADTIDKYLKKISNALLVIALVTDGIRILAAIYEDATSKNNYILPHKTIETISSIAGGWSGAALGAKTGALVGAKIGTCIGSFFGGVGAVIGAPIGAIVGSFAGAFAGGLLGSYLAENGAKIGLDYIEANGLKLDAWDETFFVYVTNPALLVKEVVEGLSDPTDPTKYGKAVSIVKGAAVGAAIGSPIGPIGTITGAVVGGAVGAVKKWFF